MSIHKMSSQVLEQIARHVPSKHSFPPLWEQARRRRRSRRLSPPPPPRWTHPPMLSGSDIIAYFENPHANLCAQRVASSKFIRGRTPRFFLLYEGRTLGAEHSKKQPPFVSRPPCFCPPAKGACAYAQKTPSGR